MPNGLLYLAILVLWAVVLIPMWLRRHERTAEHRTTRRFRHAMATLDRSRRIHRPADVMLVSRKRVSESGEEEIVVPAGMVLDASVDLHLDHGVDPFVDSDEEYEVLLARRIDSRRVAARIAAARRRRTLMALLGGGVLVGVVAGVGLVPLWLVIVPVVAAVGFLWFARSQVRSHREQDARWARRMAARRQVKASSEDQLASVAAVHGAAEPLPARRRVASASSRPAVTAAVDSHSDVSAAAAVGTSFNGSFGSTEVVAAGGGTIGHEGGSQVARIGGVASPGAADVRILTPDEVAELRHGAARGSAATRGFGRGRGTGAVRGVVGEAGRGFFTVSGPRPAVPSKTTEDVTVPGAYARARLVEQVEAISSTHQDVEAELGLDEYAFPQAAAAEQPTPLPRVVNG